MNQLDKYHMVNIIIFFKSKNFEHKSHVLKKISKGT